MAKQTAVEWLEQKLKDRYSLIHSQPLFEQAKQMEEEREYEIKCLWFGKGINAAITNRIEDLKPKRNEE